MNVCFYFNAACIESDVGDRHFICTVSDSSFSLTFKQSGVDRRCTVDSARGPSGDLLPNSGCSNLFQSLSGAASGGTNHSGQLAPRVDYTSADTNCIWVIEQSSNLEQKFAETSGPAGSHWHFYGFSGDDLSGACQTVLVHFQFRFGEVSEWFKVTDSKSVVRHAYRGFESLPLRHT